MVIENAPEAKSTHIDHVKLVITYSTTTDLEPLIQWIMLYYLTIKSMSWHTHHEYVMQKICF